MAIKLTHKEKGFVKDILEGETGVQAALNNYDTKDYSTAGAIASENLKKPKIINAIEEALPDELLAQKHKEGLDAVTYFNEIVDRDSKGAPIYSLAEVKDYSVRHKYLDTAYKIKGKFKKDESPLTPTINNLTQIIINEPYAHKTGNQPDGETVPSVASPTEQ